MDHIEKSDDLSFESSVLEFCEGVETLEQSLRKKAYNSYQKELRQKDAQNRKLGVDSRFEEKFRKIRREIQGKKGMDMRELPLCQKVFRGLSMVCPLYNLYSDPVMALGTEIVHLYDEVTKSGLHFFVGPLGILSWNANDGQFPKTSQEKLLQAMELLKGISVEDCKNMETTPEEFMQALEGDEDIYERILHSSREYWCSLKIDVIQNTGWRT